MKKLLEKYWNELEHYKNGGKLLIRNNDENIWINMTEVDWDINYKTVSIIINDEFSELRKALCDGKTVQAYYKFNDTWNDIIKPEFKDNVSNYRIKPEEPKFKAGNFIRQTKELGINVSRIYRIKAHISDILYSVEKNIYDVDAINAKEEYFELWKPSHKELCYFTHDTNTKNSAILREFREISKDGFYVDCFGARFIYCEPFLSSKPSWFND